MDIPPMLPIYNTSPIIPPRWDLTLTTNIIELNLSCKVSKPYYTKFYSWVNLHTGDI